MKSLNEIMPYIIDNHNLREFALNYFIELFKMYTNILNLNGDYNFNINTINNLVDDYKTNVSSDSELNSNLNNYLYNLNDLLSSRNPNKYTKAYFKDSSDPINIIIKPDKSADYFDINEYKKLPTHYDFFIEYGFHNVYNSDSSQNNNNLIVTKFYKTINTLANYNHSKILYTDIDKQIISAQLLLKNAKIIKGERGDISKYKELFISDIFNEITISLKNYIADFSNTVTNSIVEYNKQASNILSGGGMMKTLNVSHKPKNLKNYKTHKTSATKRNKTFKYKSQTNISKRKSKHNRSNNANTNLKYSKKTIKRQ
jgi:hypothetical protein